MNGYEKRFKTDIRAFFTSIRSRKPKTDQKAATVSDSARKVKRQKKRPVVNHFRMKLSKAELVTLFFAVETVLILSCTS